MGDDQEKSRRGLGLDVEGTLATLKRMNSKKRMTGTVNLSKKLLNPEEGLSEVKREYEGMEKGQRKSHERNTTKNERKKSIIPRGKRRGHIR